MQKSSQLLRMYGRCGLSLAWVVADDVMSAASTGCERCGSCGKQRSARGKQRQKFARSRKRTGRPCPMIKRWGGRKTDSKSNQAPSRDVMVCPAPVKSNAAEARKEFVSYAWEGARPGLPPRPSPARGEWVGFKPGLPAEGSEHKGISDHADAGASGTAASGAGSTVGAT